MRIYTLLLSLITISFINIVIAQPTSTRRNNFNIFKANSTVKINSTYDLKGDTLKLPNNVTLSFSNNGLFKNGVIVGNNTKIIANNTKIFHKDLAISGTWDIARATSNWFDCAKNGYSIDYTSFNEYQFTDGTKGLGYKYKNVLYKVGTSPNVKYTDDTYPLNQLLNLKAKHTVIESGIFMVKPTYGHVHNKFFKDQTQGLLIRDADNRKLEINGTLKVIPNNQPVYNLLVVYKSDNFELFGNGKLEGDIYEHTDNKGEWGFLFAGSGLTNFKHRNLTYEGAWGDGVYIGWSKVNAKENIQHTHLHENIKINNCRRTGLVYELGNDIFIVNCKFDGHKNHRGIATYAAIDIEPFGFKDVPIKYCKNVNVIESEFKNYKKGPAVRYERVIGGTVQSCKFFMNSSDITLGRSHSNEEIKIVRNHPENYNYVEIFNNVSDKSSYFLRTIDPKTLVYQSNALAYNNIINNPGNSVLDGIWKNLIFENNTINNAKNFGGTFNGTNITIRNNKLNNIPKIFGLEANSVYNMKETDIKAKFSNVQNFNFKK